MKKNMLSPGAIAANRHIGLQVRVGDSSFAAFAIGDEVRLAYQPFDESPHGVLTGVVITPAAFLYAVTWEDTRRETTHHELELIIVD